MFSIYPIHAAVPATTALLVQRLADLGVRVHLAGKFGNLHHHQRCSRIDQTRVVPITPACPLDSIIAKQNDATFAEFCQWIFLLDPGEERPFLITIGQLQLRLDSQVIVVTRNDSNLVDHHHQASLDILLRQDAATDSSLHVDEPRDNPELLGSLDDSLQGLRGARHHSVFTLTQLYKLNASDAGSCVRLTLGSHEITSGRLARPLPVERRNNFLGQVKITLGVLVEPAGQENGDDGHVPFYGDAGTLLRVLPEFLGASITTKPILLSSADGNQDIVRALQNHEVDFVYSRFDIDVALERKISYSIAVYHEFRNVYLRQPELSEIRDIYLAPITTSLAVAFLALAITLAVMLRLTNNLHVTTRWKRANRPRPRDTDHVSGSDAFLWFMGICCMQGSTINPNSTSSATIVIMALLFQLIVYNAYSASITSKLSIFLDEVTDLHGLLHATDFEVGFVRGGSDEAYLVTNRDRDTSEILERSLQNPVVTVENDREGLHRAIDTKFALFGRHGAVRGAVRQLGAMDFCELSEVQVLSTYQKTAFAFRKDSPYKKLLNYEILRFLQHGITNRELPFMLPGMPGCSQVKLFNKAKLSDVFSCFAVLLMGMANAFLVVLGEKFVQNVRIRNGTFRMEY